MRLHPFPLYLHSLWSLEWTRVAARNKVAGMAKGVATGRAISPEKDSQIQGIALHLETGGSLRDNFCIGRANQNQQPSDARMAMWKASRSAFRTL